MSVELLLPGEPYIWFGNEVERGYRTHHASIIAEGPHANQLRSSFEETSQVMVQRWVEVRESGHCLEMTNVLDAIARYAY